MKQLILINLIGILLVIGVASVYNLGSKDRYNQMYKTFEGNVVGFPRDGDQLKEMFNKLDHPPIIYLAPRMYYIKSNELKFDVVYDERNPVSLIGSPDGKSTLMLKD